MIIPSDLSPPCASALEVYLRPELFKALCDPTRVSIVAYLATQHQPSTVGALTEQCGIDFSGVSRHLKILKEAELVTAQRSGREVRYELCHAHLTTTLRGLADALELCEQSSA